jgi:hypothetical protein
MLSITELPNDTKKQLQDIAEKANNDEQTDGNQQAEDIKSYILATQLRGLTPEAQKYLDEEKAAAKKRAEDRIDKQYDNIGKIVATLPPEVQVPAAHTAVTMMDILTAAWSKIVDTVTNFVKTVVDGIREAVEKVVEWAQNAVNSIKQFAEDAWDAIKSLF